MSLHASMSPSRLYRILTCAGSYQMARNVPEKQSDAAAEGSLLHLAMERHITKYKARGPYCGFADQPFDNEIVSPHLDKEQVAACIDALEYLDTLIATLDVVNLFVEVQVSMLGYHPELRDIWGVSDIIIETPTEFHVIDWKFGAGIFVDVNDNDQLLAYGAGAAVDAVKITTYDKIVVHAVQPRMENYAREERTPNQMLAWINGRVLPGVTAARGSNPPFNPTPKGCQWCPVRNTCRARYNMVQQTAADVFKAHAKLPNEITPAEVSEFLKRVDGLLAMAKDLKAYAINHIKQGKDVPDWKLVSGRSTRKWISESAAAQYLEEQGCEIEDIYVSKMVTAPAAEKILRQFKKDPDFQALIEKTYGDPTLVSSKSNKPALKFKTAEEVFQDVQNKGRSID